MGRNGIFEQLNALLRRRVREGEGRTPEPTAMVLDAQSVKTSTNMPGTEQGVDDSTAGEARLNRIAATHPTLRKGWADRSYRECLVDHAARLGVDLGIVRRTPAPAGSACSRAGGRWKERSAG
ncbi:hypothetical protein AB0H82_06985 [Streptomyces sp. NPDC050732]|uniref:hypothetical protein n=1 Tax=Streptomyces sp. NPDC050732 TaxID=3154632 RepID=UPI00341F6122